MTPTTSFDVSTLRWVGKEIDKSLSDARAALEQYAEGNHESQLIDTFVDRLHVVRGTLLMIELHGAAMFAEEMEALARELGDIRGERTNQACEALMSGLVALPDYLENLSHGAADVPTSLLSLMNDLRAVRDAPLLSETSLFAPGLEHLLDAGDEGEGDGTELSVEIGEHRRDFHMGLLGWFRGDDQESLERLESAIDGFRAHSSSLRVARLFEAAAAVVDGVRTEVIESSVAVKRLIGSLDRVLKRVGTAGEANLSTDYPYDLVKNLLYYVASAKSPGTPLLEELRARYRLSTISADSDSLQDVSLFGLSAETYATVRDLLLGEITSIKDRLDVALNAERRDTSSLSPIVPQLRKISDTLGMIGMGTLRQRLMHQAESLEHHFSSEGEPETSHLTALASDLVFAESSIRGGLTKGAGADDTELDPQALPEGELERYRGAVLSEIGTEFAAVKNAVSEFVADPDRLDLIEGVPNHLDLISGALTVVQFEPAAALIQRVQHFFGELTSGRENANDAQKLEALADGIAGIEYYVELKANEDPGADSALAYAAQALDRVLPGETEAATEPEVPPVGPEPGTQADEGIGIEQESAAQPPSDSALPADFETVPLSAVPAESSETSEEPEVEEEIHDIFVEEAREQLGIVQEAYAKWRADPENEEELSTFRRGFHTLKGSGRMVGAEDIGEFAWSVENLLNRVIDGTVPVSEEVSGLLDDAMSALPELVDAEAEQRSSTVDTLPLEATAFTLAGAELPERVSAAMQAAVVEKALEPGATEGEEVEPEVIEGAADEVPVDEVSVESVPSEPAILTPSAIELDPVLADIFNGESRTHLDTVRAFVAACADANGPTDVSNDAIRAFHTLRGSANMAGVLPVAELGGASEDLLRALQQHDKGVDAVGVSVLTAVADAIEHCLNIINQPGGEEPEWRAIMDDLSGLIRRASGDSIDDQQDEPAGAVEDRVTEFEEQAAESVEAPPVDAEPRAKESAPADEPPATAASRAPDAEFLELFVEEARELQDQMESSYTRWAGGDTEALPELKRVLHTLKGAARLAGIPEVGNLSHAFETMLIEIPEEPDGPPQRFIDLGRQACDRLMEQTDMLASGKGVPVFADLLASLEKRGEAPPPPAEPEPVAAPETPVVEPVQQEKPAEKKPKPAAARRKVPQREGERIRISTEMLDRMVDNVGEVGIYASRLAQQHNLAHFNLGELEQTVARLKQQLRNLEIETEAQILYRYEREGGDRREGPEDFDPLELDRFSNIQEFSRALVETVSDLGNICEYLKNGSRDVDMLMLQQSRIVTDLQNELLRTRLVPFTQQVSRLERLVRQTCAPLGKKARLVVRGRETELDRGVLEQTMPLLEHLLRNAVSHGIEHPDDRKAAEKPEEATVTLRLGRDGMDVVLSVSDDGRGLDAEAIRLKAIEQGFIEPDAPLEHDDALRLILAPGFSTATKVTQISGRGVGLDVVNSEVKQLGGRLEVRSREGEGSTFTIRLPFSLAITDVLLLEMGEEVMAVPHSTIETVVRIPRDKLLACRDGSDPGFQYAGHNYPVRYFGQLFGIGTPPVPEQNKWMPALLVHTGDRRMALQVDGLLGTRQIVVKSVGPQLSVVPWILGGTILGDGRVALISDVTSLVRSMATEMEVTIPVEGEVLRQVTVMVVDDSITVRRVTSRLLERHNMNVVTAKDGVEAVALLQETTPDVMLLDIEMPRMDGFEVARHVRNNPEVSNVPIIMITSRTGEKHRERAASIGVERYLGKPYQEEELMDTILEVLAGVTE